MSWVRIPLVTLKKRIPTCRGSLFSSTPIHLPSYIPPELPRPLLPNRKGKEQTAIVCSFVVGKDGFEPPKSKDSRFTVCPIWPLWNLPLPPFFFEMHCKDSAFFLIGKRKWQKMHFAADIPQPIITRTSVQGPPF